MSWLEDQAKKAVSTVEKAAGSTKDFMGKVRPGASLRSYWEGAPDWFLPAWATKQAYSVYDQFTGKQPGVPAPPAPPDWEAMLASMQGNLDPRKRGTGGDTIFAGRNYHWTGSVTGGPKGKGGV